MSVSFNWAGAHHIDDASVLCDLAGVVYADSFRYGVVLYVCVVCVVCVGVCVCVVCIVVH